MQKVEGSSPFSRSHESPANRGVFCCPKHVHCPLLGPSSARTPAEINNASANTIVESPSENQKPTDRARFPSAISFRVVWSIAAM
jgi:hypothetical protein